MLTTILFAAAVICAAGWFGSWLSTMALLCYLEEKGFPFPDTAEIKTCSRKAAARMFSRRIRVRPIQDQPGRPVPRNQESAYKITTFYADNDPCQTVLTISLGYRDWCELERAPFYQELIGHLEHLETPDSTHKTP